MARCAQLDAEAAARARRALRRSRAGGGGGRAAALLPSPGARARDRRGARARPCPDAHVSLSHEVVGTFREYERAATTEVDAALSPLLGRLPAAARRRAARVGLPEPTIMQSNGGLIDLAGRRRPRRLDGALRARRRRGRRRLRRAGRRCTHDALCFDMGGTSCDVCVVDDGSGPGAELRHGRRAPAGAADARRAHRRCRRRLDRLARPRRRAARRPALGRGRSRARPATGAAGPSRPSPTPTWCSATSPPTRRWPAASSSTAARAERAIGALAAAARAGAAACAEGIIRVANAEMVRALRVVTVQRGIDPRRYALLAFGGAGAAARGADRRGARDRPRSSARAPPASWRRSGWSSPRAGVMSSAAFCCAGTALTAEAIAGAVGELGAQARAELRRATSAELRATYELRYRGQAFELAVAARAATPTPRELREAFEADARGALRLPRSRAGARAGDRPRHRRSCPAPRSRWRRPARRAARRGGAGPHSTARRSSSRSSAARRPGGTGSRGPAVVELPESTLLVPPGWAGEVRRGRTIRVREHGRDDDRSGRAPGPDRRAARDLRGDGRGADPLGALGQHQGAPRRLDRAVRRRDGRDGHAGRAHPRAPRRDARRGRRGARRASTPRSAPGSSTTPTAAAPTCPTSRSITPVFAGSGGRSADRLRRQPRPPRRRRRPHPGLDARRQPHARRRGRGDRAARARRRGDRRAQRADAPARPAARRPARPARRRPRRGAPRRPSCTSASAVDTLRAAFGEVLDYAERRTRACLAQLDGRRAPTRGTCSRRARATSRIALRATVDGRRAHARLHRQRRPARGQPQLPAGRDPLGLLLRDPRAHRPRHPRQRRRLPAGRRDRARGLAAQRPLAGGGGRRATSRPPRGSPTSCWGRSAARSGRGR